MGGRSSSPAVRWKLHVHRAAAAVKCALEPRLAVSTAVLHVAPENLIVHLQLLGAATNGEYEVSVTPDGVTLDAANQRADKACRLAQRCADYALSNIAQTTLHSAWLLLSKCVAASFSYDARLVPSEVLADASLRVQTSLVTAVKRVFGGQRDG